MIINREWAMPNQWTFTITPIKQLVYKYCPEGIGWVDPFCGENSPAEITNDLNPERPSKFNMDALDFLKSLSSNSAKGILFDPPYSFSQAKECYDSFGKDLFVTHDKIPTMMDYWSECKKEMSRIIEPSGYAICFGWNSNGIGQNRGFNMVEILIVSHGGSKNDTMVTVEQKITSQLF